MKKNVKIILLSSVAVLLLAVVTFLCVWFLGAKYPSYDRMVKYHSNIPALDESIVPQGLCALNENSDGYDFAMSGYSADDQPSRIYLIDEDANESKWFTLKNPSGKLYTSHFGGVACGENYLYVTSGENILRVSLVDIFSAINGAEITVFDSFSSGISNSFCYLQDGYLYTGEFVNNKKYIAPKEHELIVSGGVTHYALTFVFAIDETKEGGVKSNIPEKVISTINKVQGVAVTSDRIYLSTSYGLSDSVFYSYENILNSQPSGKFDVGGNLVDLYYLDDSALVQKINAPSMSEGICVKNGRLYILYESNSVKYKLFTRRKAKTLESIELKNWN